MKFIQDISIFMAILYIICYYNTLYLHWYISLAVLPPTSTLQEKNQNWNRNWNCFYFVFFFANTWINEGQDTWRLWLSIPSSTTATSSSSSSSASSSSSWSSSSSLSAAADRYDRQLHRHLEIAAGEVGVVDEVADEVVADAWRCSRDWWRRWRRRQPGGTAHGIVLNLKRASVWVCVCVRPNQWQKGAQKGKKPWRTCLNECASLLLSSIRQLVVSNQRAIDSTELPQNKRVKVSCAIVKL